MKIEIDLECRTCHHRDHSGSFTIGGARAICGHSDACRTRKSEHEFKNEYPEYHKRGDHDKNWRFHWFNRIIDNEIENGEVPNWCPVKNGSKY